jgi:hypothetical protein
MRTIVVLIAIVCLSTPAAAQLLRQPNQNAPVGHTNKKISPLTVNECQGLGGKVTSMGAGYCATGMKCTIQETGRELCITVKE